jgi:hypothetical protein
MRSNVGKRTIEYLQQHPQCQYTAREIAEWIFTSYPQEYQVGEALIIDREVSADALG